VDGRISSATSGDDFIILTAPGRAEAFVAECTSRAKKVIERAVGDDAAKQGSFTGVDREGQVRRFPLARLSTAVLLVRPDAWVNLQHLGMRAADVKRRQQRGPGTVSSRRLMTIARAAWLGGPSVDARDDRIGAASR
jgi:hypothetical protein